VETSGFGGLHKHILVLPDGTEVESLSPSELISDSVDYVSDGLPPASLIANSLNELSLKREADERMGPGMDLNAAFEQMKRGEFSTPDSPSFTMEVVKSDHQSMEYGIPGSKYFWSSRNGIKAESGDLIDVRHDGEVIGFSKHVVPDPLSEVVDVVDNYEIIKRHTTKIPFIGPRDAKLLFVLAAPSDVEIARKKALVGDDGVLFEDEYLRPLGVTKGEVGLGFIMPVLPFGEPDAKDCEKWSDHLVEAMKSFPKAKVVALGRVSREVLKSANVLTWSLPHPKAIRNNGNSGELPRKLKAISKSLDVNPLKMAKLSRRQGKSLIQDVNPRSPKGSEQLLKHSECRVIKSAEEKKIVYGVVLDPYVIDLQSDWIPPAEIEATAHDFIKKSRVIGFEHIKKADAQIVESWVEPYPTTDDYKAAIDGRPHKAFTRQFGDDEVHSGTWVAGVQLGEKEWEMHKQGKLNAFSVGGFSFKTKVSSQAMPKVEFIELVGAPA